MKKLVTTRQIIFVLVISMLTIKVLILPNLFFSKMDKDGYVGLFIMLIIDFISLMIFLFLMRSFPDKSFFEVMEILFGKVVAKVLLFVLFLYFFGKCWSKFQGNFVYLNENLYSTFNWYIFSIPMVICLSFCCVQGVKSLARLTEIFAPIVILGFCISLFVGIGRAEFSSVLPFFENSFKELLSCFQLSHWFGDYWVLILFFGRLKLEGKDIKKILLVLFGSIILLTFFYVCFFATYKRNSICHTNAISDILQVVPSVADVGSFDWALILIWDISLFLSLLFDTMCAVLCFREVFFKKFHVLVSLFVTIAMVVLNYFLGFNFLLLLNIMQSHFWIFSFAVQVVIPVVILVIALGKKIMNNKKNSQSKDLIVKEKRANEKFVA